LVTTLEFSDVSLFLLQLAEKILVFLVESRHNFLGLTDNIFENFGILSSKMLTQSNSEGY
jgi:hypothetical protein